MPADRIAYLTLEEVLVVHDQLLKAFGGPAGGRDLGLLEQGTADLEHLLPWISDSLQKL